jgi:hypothetical protein
MQQPKNSPPPIAPTRKPDPHVRNSRAFGSSHRTLTQLSLKMANEAILPATFARIAEFSGYLVGGTVFFGTAVSSAHDCTIQQSKPPGRRREFWFAAHTLEI